MSAIVFRKGEQSRVGWAGEEDPPEWWEEGSWLPSDGKTDGQLLEQHEIWLKSLGKDASGLVPVSLPSQEKTPDTSDTPDTSELDEAREFLNEWSKASVKAKKGEFQITLADETGSERVSRKGWLVGDFFGVHLPEGDKSDEYLATHLPTGLRASYIRLTLPQARTYATVLSLVGDWSFSTPDQMPAEHGKQASQIARWFENKDWVALAKFVKEKQA